MGGFGSGRYFRFGDKKKETSDVQALDVRELQREGLLRPNRTRIAISHQTRSHGEEWETMKYSVRLEWTPCYFGGRRAWFLCPACGRRVAILYGNSVITCRHCCNLAYACQRESVSERAMRRIDSIRVRLGWGLGFLNGEGSKPKGMHWRTFERLKVAHDACVDASLASFPESLKKALVLNLNTAE